MNSSHSFVDSYIAHRLLLHSPRDTSCVPASKLPQGTGHTKPSNMGLPTSMRALVLDAINKTAAVQRIPLPRPGRDEVLVKVHSIALNPVDALYVSNPLGQSGRTIGSDFSGTVVSVPTTSTLHSGDRVAGFLQGACSVNDRPGAFTEYLICPADLLWLVPASMTFEQAATVSLCALTAAQAIFYRMGLLQPFAWCSSTSSRPTSPTPMPTPMESRNPRYFFIYGASTSVGLYAAQLVRSIPTFATDGRPIVLIGAASKARFKALSAAPYNYDHLVDYREAEWPTQILDITGGNGVDFAYDCISEGSTVGQTASVLNSKGKLAIVRSREGGAWTSDDLRGGIEPSYGAVWEGLGEAVQYQGMSLLASKEARGFAVAFYEWLSSGKARVMTTPVRLMPGGLEKVVEDGLTLLGPGSMDDRGKGRNEEWMKPVSVEKLVYHVSAA